MHHLVAETKKSTWPGASLNRIALPESQLRDLLRRHGREDALGRFLANMAPND